MLDETDKRIKARIISAPHTRLLAWYARNRRDLPWRRTRDPYAVLVSEIMLQQTRVAAVIPYYERWMKAFPTVQSLAKARVDRVLRLWAGLGYYSRARNLHETAKIVVSWHGSRIPSEVAALQSLPGVGRYTAGAVASIAFNKPAPILDGNVIRVLSRLFLISKDTTKTKGRNQLWKLAEQIIPPAHAGDFNQALMELGALICVPLTPKCHECPLSRVCLARLNGKESELPILRKRRATKSVSQFALILRRGDSVWIKKRQRAELMAGLWSFPRFESKRQLLEQSGLRTVKSVGRVKHSVMNQQITVSALVASVNGNAAKHFPAHNTRWVKLDRLNAFALPSADRQLAELIR